MKVHAGTAGPTADLVKQLASACPGVERGTISFVGAAELAKRAGSAGDGIIVSQVVPPPTERSHGIVRSYLNAIDRHGSGETPDFAMLEGYVIGRVTAELVRRAGTTPTRESFLAAAFGARNTFDLDGLSLRYGPGDNLGTSNIYLTRLGSGGHYSSVEAGLRAA